MNELTQLALAYNLAEEHGTCPDSSVDNLDIFVFFGAEHFRNDADPKAEVKNILDEFYGQDRNQIARQIIDIILEAM